MSAYSEGVDDYIQFGIDCVCPYAPDTEYAADWYEGFNDSSEWLQPDMEN